jgi:hypothetical protein
MKKALIVLFVFPTVSLSAQKIKPYVYGEVESVTQFRDGQVISYKDKSGKVKSDTIMFSTQKKQVTIDWSHKVATDSRYLKPPFKLNKK